MFKTKRLNYYSFLRSSDGLHNINTVSRECYAYSIAEAIGIVYLNESKSYMNYLEVIYEHKYDAEIADYKRTRVYVFDPESGFEEYTADEYHEKLMKLIKKDER